MEKIEKLDSILDGMFFCLSVKVLYTFVYTYVGIRGSLQVVVIEKSSYVRLLERHLSQGKMPETLFVQWTMP